MSGAEGDVAASHGAYMGVIFAIIVTGSHYSVIVHDNSGKVLVLRLGYVGRTIVAGS